MTPEELLFLKYRGKRILLDSNLLLLFMVGSFQRNRISTFKRTAQFSESQFDVLVQLMAQFNTVVTTPHVLTEVGNLANSLPENIKPFWCEHFASQTAKLLELLEPAVDIMQETSFNPFGLTDAALHKASADTLLVTEDIRLSGFLRASGVAVLNLRDVVA